MYYPYYHQQDLEILADNLNRRYDKNRLAIPKQVDVYDIVDMLGARLAFEFLSPDRTYLGATVFNSGMLRVWPGNPYVHGMFPKDKFFHADTIIIDRDLNESNSEQDHCTENFTVMHECFHFDQHKTAFEQDGHMSKGFDEYAKQQADKNSALYKLERQANYFSAAFLMPQKATIAAAKEFLDYDGKHQLSFGYHNKEQIKEMGKVFGVNYSPMCFRLQDIGILDRKFNSHI